MIGFVVGDEKVVAHQTLHVCLRVKVGDLNLCYDLGNKFHHMKSPTQLTHRIGFCLLDCLMVKGVVFNKFCECFECKFSFLIGLLDAKFMLCAKY